MSTPWGALPPETPPLEGDWLPGCGMMWKTATVLNVGFNEDFEGYSLGEDLDFSLRAGREGRLFIAPAARLKHLHAADGRPQSFQLGYATIYNRYQIHRRGLTRRGFRDIAAFTYAWTLDTLLAARRIFSRRDGPAIRKHVRGRLAGAWDLI